MVGVDDDVPCLHAVATMDAAIRTCVGSLCLSNPALADISLMRAKGMAVP